MALSEDELKQVKVQTKIKCLEDKEKLSTRQKKKLFNLQATDTALERKINNRQELANNYARNTATKINNSKSSKTTNINTNVNSNNTNKSKNGFFAKIISSFKKSK